MPFRVLPSLCTVAALLVAGLAVPSSASAATPPEDSKSASATTLQIEGTLTVAEIETMGRTPSSKTAYAVTTDDGFVVPITLKEDHAANSSFSGELVVRDELAEVLDDEGLLPPAGRTIDGDSAAGQAATAAAVELGTPLPVAEATVIAPGETSQTATPSAHRAYVVKMIDQGSVEGTNAEIGAKVDNVLSYWTTESGGAITSFARQGAILDFDSAANVPANLGCGINDPFPLWNDALKLFPGVNFNNAGNHLIVLVGDECGKSGPVGVATVGLGGLASGGPSILTYEPQSFAATGVHELGHNFGLQHANLDTCPTVNICEYYDIYSPMALSIGGAPVFTPTALGTLYRTELDVTTPSEVTNVTSPQAALTQSFSLAARSASSGQRGLLVTDPSTGTTYSVDWRSGTGRDASAFYAYPNYNFPAPIPTYPAGVVIERQSDRDDTYLMTRTVNNRQVGSFAAGNTFSPTPRLSIAVNSIGSTANVTVAIAPPTDVPSAVPTISGTAAVGQFVTAQPGVWASGTTIAYDWKIDGVSTGVTTRISDVPGSAVGKQMTVSVTGSKPGFNTVTRTSAPLTVANGTLTAATPTIAGTPAVGRQVTAQPGTWTSGTSFAYNWLVDGVSTGVTTSTLDVPDAAAGKQLTVEVTGSKTGYTPISRVSAASTVAKGTLTSSLPTLNKAPVVDETVTAEPGAWTTGTTFAYDWRLDGTSTGVTTPSFTVPDSAAGKALTVVATGSKTGYDSASRTSAAASVGMQALTTSAPTLSGTPTVGGPVTAQPGTWTTGTTFTYDWLLGGVSTGVTTPAYDVPASAAGEQLAVRVTGSRSGYATEGRTSVGVTVAKGTLTSPTPTISGTVAVGERVTAEPGDWTSGTSLTYDWKIDGDSTGVTTRTFDVPASAAAKQLTVAVTGTKSGYTTASKTSDGIAVAAGVLTSGTPTITGTPAVGEQVAADAGTWLSGTAFTYEWSVDGESTGVTARTFDLPASAAGKQLTVEVTGSKDGYTSISKTSAAVTVAKGTLEASTPTLDKAPVVDETVTVQTGSWTAGTSFTYDWLLDDESTGVATKTFDVPASAVGKDLTVVVTGTKAGYQTETRTTVAATIAEQALTTATPTLSGNPAVGETLTAEPGAWTNGTSFAYDWIVDGVSTGIGTRTFDVPASAAGERLTVEVTGSKSGYATVSRTSVGVTVDEGTLTSATPTISGTVKVGEEVEASAGTWTSGTSFTYDWLVDDESTGVTTKTFTVPASANGQQLTVEVTGTKLGYATRAESSGASTVAAGDLVVSIPNIVGTTAVGKTVVAEPRFWTSGTIFAFDWLIDGVSTGVTTQTFEIPDTAAGAELTVKVAGSKPGYTSASMPSGPSQVAKGTLASSPPTLDKAPVVDETVTAATGDWTSGTSFAYSWKVDGISTGVTTASFDVPASAVGKPLTVTVTGTRTGYDPAARTSAEATVRKRALATSVPTISGPVAVGRTVTAEPGSWTPGTSFTYDWTIDGESTGVTTASFDVPASAVGESLAVEVTGSKSGYETAVESSAGSTVAEGALATSAPSITGTVVVDGTVTAEPGSWTPGTSFTYDWKVDGESTGITTQTFEVPDTAAGKSLTVEVTGTKAGYKSATESSAASTVAEAALATSAPSITGTVAVGNTVMAEPSFWTSGTIFAYDWMIDGESTGVVTQTFEIPDTAAGADLTVEVTGTRNGYTTASRISVGSTVAKGTLASSVPTVVGVAAVDETVTSMPGSWTTGTSFAYDWLVDGVSTGVTTASFEVPDTAVGLRLAVTVTGSRAGYDSAARTSAEVTVEEQELAASTPTLSGIPTVGEQVTAEPGSWTPGTSFAYDWLVDGVSAGVTTRGFDVPDTAAGKQLTVTVAGTRNGYAGARRTSAAVTVAEGALTTSVPTITGTVAVGGTVTAAPGSWTDGTSFAYDWLVDGESTGITTLTYDIPVTAAGADLTVEVTGTKRGYEPATESSVGTTVANGALATSEPNISGAVKVGKTVMAEPGFWTSGTIFAFDWLVDGESTGVATQTFDVPDTAAGKALTVEVTGSKLGYTTRTRASAKSTVGAGDLASSVPSITGRVAVGESVAVDPGTWTSGTSFVFDWLVDGISTGVSTETFEVPDSAAGGALTVKVTGSKPGYATSARTSTASAVANGTLATSEPSILGAATVGETVTADAGSWTPGTAFAYDWLVDGESTGVTASSFDVPASAAGAELTVEVTGTKPGYEPATESSAGSTVAEGALATAVPTLAGAVAVDRTVTAVPGTWTPGTSFTYEWRLYGVSTGVDTPTFDIPDTAAGAALTVEVTGTKVGYEPAIEISDAVTVAEGALVSSVPNIAGTVKVGETAMAEPGFWSSGTVFAYDWLVDGESTGVHTQMFDVPDTAAGAELTVEVTGTRTGYAATTRLSTVSVVANGTLESTQPSVDGRLAVDETVTAVPFTWTPGTVLAYDWQIDGVSTGVGTQTFDIPDTAAGKLLTVTVTGTRAGYDSASRTSEERIVAEQLLASDIPTIAGAPTVGETVEVNPGSWSPGTSFAYDWLIDGESTGATTKRLVVPGSAAGRPLTVEVTGTKRGYGTVTQISDASMVTPAVLATSEPIITGKVAVGETVTADPGAWTSGTSFGYDWQVGGVSTGVDTPTFDIPDTAAGAELRVFVTGTKTGYHSSTQFSSASTVARGLLVSSVPNISGTVAVGQVVTAEPGFWTSGTVFAYDWMIDGESTGIDTQTFAIPDTATGAELTVTVAGTRVGYDPVERTSAEVTVEKLTLDASKPTLSGTPTVGVPVTAEPGSWTSGTSFAYDWLLGGVSTGVTTKTYNVPAAAAGASLSVKVTGSKSGFEPVSQTSAAQTVAAGTLAAGAVAISGAPRVGAAVTASEGAWTPGSSLTFAWFSGATLLGTDRTLVVPAAAVGGSLRLVVTGSRAGYQTRTAETASGAVAPGTLTGATPKISGTARVGKTLKAKAGTWSLKPTLRYQWYANGKKITSKGNKASFKLTNKQKGKKVTVRVTGSKPGYTTLVKASKPTKKVAKKK